MEVFLTTIICGFVVSIYVEFFGFTSNYECFKDDNDGKWRLQKRT